MPATPALRADLYWALAAVLSDPPDWFCRAGKKWPLYTASEKVAFDSPSARRALDHLATIPAESSKARRKRYIALFSGPEQPGLWLYESLYVNGRFLGPASALLDRLYRTAGLSVDGAELPDHVSVELAFLAHLAEQQEIDATRAHQWRKIELGFAEQHAGRWIPKLGRSLQDSGDEVYGPIGYLLNHWLLETWRPESRHKSVRSRRRAFPSISDEGACNLCAFCAQVCDENALAMSESNYETRLILEPNKCTGCRKCIRICQTGALSLSSQTNNEDAINGGRVLRRSPRVLCPGCHAPTVSEAELAYVAQMIGQQPWLEYCLDCRTS